MKVLVIQKNNLWEKHWFFALFLPLALAPYIQHANTCQFSKAPCADSCRNRNKRIIPAAAGNRIEFIFPSLKSLLEFPDHIGIGLFFRRFLIHAQFYIFVQAPLVGFFRIRLQYFVHLRHSKTPILLAGRA